ncbi:MAG: VOC family protein [Nitrospinota bacterium]|jgi:catechol 2,3-dioxygenase-like lactoylglutathione lyase family enzyme|nr:hypothetical protein [Nitrospinota bacterium]MDP6277547.1 VOC family protein [Nitrospinota bacterium]MDP6366032.1 VOC family protein [Nitrospinota bacterium]MDP7166643.1 VOC family protein [Nitrospinota bacterium]MDP7371906.1 VOC family protein [Nitrospinota bacterium]
MERPKFKCLDHLALKVRDLEKSIDFYVGLLGWRACRRRPVRGSRDFLPSWGVVL